MLWNSWCGVKVLFRASIYDDDGKWFKSHIATPGWLTHIFVFFFALFKKKMMMDAIYIVVHGVLPLLWLHISCIFYMPWRKWVNYRYELHDKKCVCIVFVKPLKIINLNKLMRWVASHRGDSFLVSYVSHKYLKIDSTRISRTDFQSICIRNQITCSSITNNLSSLFLSCITFFSFLFI